MLEKSKYNKTRHNITLHIAICKIIIVIICLYLQTESIDFNLLRKSIEIVRKS